MSVTVLGLDLSLRATGICVIDPSWEPGSWEGVRGDTFGVSLTKDATPQEIVERLAAIKRFVLEAVPVDADASSWAIGVEQYGYAMAMQSHAHALGELGGCIKLALFTSRKIVAVPVVASSARKLLLGRGAGKGIKEEVQRQLRAARAPLRGTDQCDAFAVANAMRADLGMPALSFATVPPPAARAPRERRPRGSSMQRGMFDGPSEESGTASIHVNIVARGSL